MFHDHCTEKTEKHGFARNIPLKNMGLVTTNALKTLNSSHKFSDLKNVGFLVSITPLKNIQCLIIVGTENTGFVTGKGGF